MSGPSPQSKHFHVWTFVLLRSYRKFQFWRRLSWYLNLNVYEVLREVSTVNGVHMNSFEFSWTPDSDNQELLQSNNSSARNHSRAELRDFVTIMLLIKLAMATSIHIFIIQVLPRGLLNTLWISLKWLLTFICTRAIALPPLNSAILLYEIPQWAC